MTRVAPHRPSQACFLRRGGARSESRGRHARALVLVWSLAACSVPVATDLEDAAANRVVAALGRNGIAADKQRDPDQEGRFSVDVGRADASFALGVMAREELPPEQTPGFSDAFGQSSFIPSRSDEQAKLLLATTGELQRSLSSIDRVISARVHLALPRPSLSDPASAAAPPSASVLLKYGGSELPISVAEVRELVAGAVPGLLPEGVTVVTKAVASPVERTGTELVRLGPLTTTRSSLPYLRWMIACVATLNACMVALLFALWLRMKRSHAVEPRAEPETPE